MNNIILSHEETLATRLHTVQSNIRELKLMEETLKDELMANMKEQGVKTIKLDTGVTFIRAERQTLKVKDEEKAALWADKNNCWKIDTTKAFQILRREIKLPKFFKVDTTEYLSIKSSTQSDEG